MRGEGGQRGKRRNEGGSSSSSSFTSQMSDLARGSIWFASYLASSQYDVVHYTGLGEGVGPRLREIAPPLARGSEEAGFTQPRTHSLSQPCTRYLTDHERVRAPKSQTQTQTGRKEYNKRTRRPHRRGVVTLTPCPPVPTPRNIVLVSYTV